MKKLAVSIILSASLALTVPSPVAAQSVAAAEVQEAMPLTEKDQAQAYIEQLLKGDADALETQYLHTQELLDALKKSGGFSVLQKQLGGLGKLKSIGRPIVSQLGPYTSFSVPCVFFLKKLNIVLNVDEEGFVAGIVTDVYKEAEEETTEEQTEEEETGTDAPLFFEVTLPLPVEGSNGWELPGILTLPRGDGPFPAVVLVHGSGPQDMDETLGENRPFRDIAEKLAAYGIAVYRYDKRTFVYGQELAEDTGLTLYGETIQDAAAAVSLLAQQDAVDPDRIFVLGHSLGGQALPAVFEELSSPAAGFIFLAAPARSLVDLLREQYNFLYSISPGEPAALEASKAETNAMLDLLEEPDSLPAGVPTGGAYPAYWQYLADYDALSAAEQISIPCLVLQGEEDYQVSMTDFSLWQERFAGNGLWTFKHYPGLTHFFMSGRKKDGPSAYMVAGTVDVQVIYDIAEFIAEAAAVKGQP